MKRKPGFQKIIIFAVLFVSLASCKKNSTDPVEFSYASIKKFDITFYALSGGTMIDKMSTTTPGTILNSASITGLQSMETILAMDFRPATGQLYGLGSTGRLYVINAETGASRMIGANPITPALSGNVAGFDFNPTVDRIRVVTSTGQNLRLNPETGTVAATDLPINGITGAMITGVAYTNNLAGAATTTLYDIDVTTQKLYRQVPPNDGKLVEVGPIKLNITGEGGFDIAPKDSVALAIYKVNGKSALFIIDLTTGEGKLLQKFDKEIGYTGIAIPTEPVAYATDMMNNLLVFNPTNTSRIISKTMNGLLMGEKVIGLDFRPLNGQLFGVTSNSRIVTINASSGLIAVTDTLTTPLVGTDVGFDFNPTVDRIRIISSTGQNFRYNPNDLSAMVTADINLNPGMPVVTGAAYTNNFAGATTTMLFDIDVNTDKLYLQSPPNNGTLVEIGSLHQNVEAANGFDIGGSSGKAWAILTVGGRTGLYMINTATGAATMQADFTVAVTGFTVGLGF